MRITHNASSIDPSLHENIINSTKFKSMREISDAIDTNYIFGSTCLQMNNNFLQCLRFDYCIMDEASQLNEPLAIGPILMSKVFIMIGDYY